MLDSLGLVWFLICTNIRVSTAKSHPYLHLNGARGGPVGALDRESVHPNGVFFDQESL